MFDTIIETITDPRILVSVLAGIAVVATIVTLAMPLLATDRLGRRIKAVATEREQIRTRERARLANETKRANVRNVEPTRYVKGIVERFNLRKALADDNTLARLRVAGLRGQAPLFAFLFARLVLPITMFLAAVGYFAPGSFSEVAFEPPSGSPSGACSRIGMASSAVAMLPP